MTRHSALALLPAAALLLCACGAPAASASQTQETAADPKSQPAQTELAADQDADRSAGTLRLLVNTSDKVVTMNETAAYLATQQGDAWVGTKIDLTTGQQEVLCQKAGCTHSDESCPAYLAAADARALLLADSDRLYWISGTYGTDPDHPANSLSVDVSDANGGDRQRWLTLDDTEYNFAGFDFWAADDTALYASNRQSVWRLDEDGATLLHDGAPGNLPADTLYGDEDQVSYDFCVGVWNNAFVFVHSPGFDPPTPTQAEREALSSGSLAGEAAAYIEKYDEEAKKRTETLFTVDTAGNQTELPVSFQEGGCGVPKLAQGKVWRMLGEQDAATELWCADLTTGEEQTRPVPQTGAWWNSAPDVMGDCVRIIRDDGYGYIWDLTTDELRQQPVTYYKDLVSPCTVYPVAYNDTTALLQVGVESSTETGVDASQDLYSYIRQTPIYGIQPLQEYLNCGEEWAPVTLLAEDLA